MIRGEVDRTLARQRLEPQLSTAELRPRGLPPSAVLCVRRLADPLPGRIELDSTQARPPPEWERAFVDALTRLLARAARPAREAVPANAEAVLFADRSELLACLARDARDGVAWTRWWWRSLWPDAPPGGDPVVAAWLAAPEHVPGALALLSARGEAVSFVGALPLAAAAQLARRVAAAYGAVELERALAPLVSPTAVSAAGRVAPATRVARKSGEPGPAAPWTSTVPEARAQPLAPAREALLGVALSLRRTPAAAGAGAFATAVATWLEQPPSAAPPAAPPRAGTAGLATEHDTIQALAPEPNVQEAHAPRDEPRESAPEKRRAVDALLHTPSAGTATTSAPLPAQPSLPDAASPAPRPPSDDAPERSDATSPAAPDAAAAAGPRTSPAAAVAPETRAGPAGADALVPARAAPATPQAAADAVEDLVDEPWEAPAIGIETDLGGAFYLLNLFLYLGLYGDFTQPLPRGLALDPWTCVALVARRLLGPGDRRDPLWNVLERLARPSTFRPPRAWRTPRTWLEPFDDDGEWRWSAAGGTLRLEHPAGFVVLAVPRTGEPAHVQLERELRRLRIAPSQLRRATLRREPVQPLARWVARLGGYVEARLRVALELPIDTLLRRRARVFVTASHVDVVLSLSELPLEVRFAGLDRTPGWIPAAGRFVAFHFE